MGSTTVRANSAATAASMALPPPSSISAPAPDASGWLVTTIPFEATAGCFSQTIPAKPLPAWLISSAMLVCPLHVSLDASHRAREADQSIDESNDADRDRNQRHR